MFCFFKLSYLGINIINMCLGSRKVQLPFLKMNLCSVFGFVFVFFQTLDKVLFTLGSERRKKRMRGEGGRGGEGGRKKRVGNEIIYM